MKKNNIHTYARNYTNGVYTIKEVEELLSQIKKDRSILEREMDSYWNSMETDLTSSLEHEKYKKEAHVLLSTLQVNKRYKKMQTLFRYAAAIILLLLMGRGGGFLYNQFSFQQDTVYTELYVKNSEHKTITLSDGTIITLNSGSYMRFPSRFDGDTRTVEIDGEAFFNVYSDKRKPFIVRTENADIKVLGTSFNVNAYKADEQISVSVKTGKVQVDMDEMRMDLLPNEEFVLDKASGEIQKRNIKNTQVISWMDGGLYFNKTPIKSVAKTIERIYNCKIEFEDDIDINLYGAHDNQSLESVLKSIQYTTGIKYRYERERIILYK